MLKILNHSQNPKISLVDLIASDLIISVETIANLKAFEPSYNGQTINLLGHTTAGIGGGNFYADYADTTTADDDGTVIVTGGGKRWKRILNGFIDTDIVIIYSRSVYCICIA